MIVCEQFIFIHLHKSGGTFVNQLMLQCLPCARQIGYHLPYRETPALYRSLPVLGTVRNPWEYYVSWYFFQAAQPRPNPLFRLCSRDGRLGFTDTVRRLAGLFSDAELVEALRGALPDDFRSAGLNLTKTCLDGVTNRGIGFYSFLYDRMYAGAGDPIILGAAHLREALRSALDELGVMPNARADLFLRQAPRLNVSKHGPYREYYDGDLRDLVAAVDGDLIRKHGYKF
jgi:hypothetical protein